MNTTQESAQPHSALRTFIPQSVTIARKANFVPTPSFFTSEICFDTGNSPIVKGVFFESAKGGKTFFAPARKESWPNQESQDTDADERIHIQVHFIDPYIKSSSANRSCFKPLWSLAFQYSRIPGSPRRRRWLQSPCTITNQFPVSESGVNIDNYIRRYAQRSALRVELQDGLWGIPILGIVDELEVL